MKYLVFGFFRMTNQICQMVLNRARYYTMVTSFKFAIHVSWDYIDFLSVSLTVFKQVL